MININTSKKAGTSGGKTGSLDVDDCITQLNSKCGYAALVLARMITADWAGSDARIIIDTESVIIESGDESYVVNSGMRKMSKI